ncbi:MAG TPA: hypothetical protein VE505_02385 [Vicinamibacterales bacterium]|nr:hypothetical protein [Vicinamibacterales bacterium]
MPRRFIRKNDWEFGGEPPTSEESRELKPRKRRLATTLAFTTLFFAGGSLAAVAGDQLSRYLPSEDTAAEAIAPDATATPEAEGEATPATAAETAAAESEASVEAAAPDATAAPEAEAATPDAAATPEASAPEATTEEAQDYLKPKLVAGTYAAPSAKATGKRPTRAQRAKQRKEQLMWTLLPKSKPAPAPEIEGPADAATIWLNSPLPDPTPPATRLSPKFAANLKVAAKGAGVDWAVLLGVLRARGATGKFPADRATLGKLAGQLGSHGPTKGDWATIVAYAGDTRFADKAAALARYDRAVGLTALVKGLDSAKPRIATRLLSDRMVSIYGAGRNDIVADRVDVRVLAMIAYLRETFGQITVSSLISGHRLYARPGVVSAHIPGRAVDIAALSGVSIHGNQQPGGITERAVREILFAPAEIMPRQVISLLGMGGPSFPMGNHHDHIHLGW